MVRLSPLVLPTRKITGHAQDAVLDLRLSHYI